MLHEDDSKQANFLLDNIIILKDKLATELMTPTRYLEKLEELATLTKQLSDLADMLAGREASRQIRTFFTAANLPATTSAIIESKSAPNETSDQKSPAPSHG